MEERVHTVLVAGQDDDQVVAVVLHHLQQDLDRLRTVVALVLWPVKVVGLVDEQHPAHSLLDHLLGLGCGVADVLSDQVVACDRDQVALPHVTQAMEYLGHAHGDGGLAGAGVAGEAHVERGRDRRQVEFLAYTVNQQECRGFTDACLDRHQANQLTVQLAQYLFDVGVLKLCVQVNRSVVREDEIAWGYGHVV